MTAGTVVLWRHGQTDYNLAGRMQGQVDIPLNAVGLAQAAVGAKALASAFQPAVIVSSDLVRAQVTAQALGEATGSRVRLDSRLRERSFGIWEGLTREEIVAAWPGEFEQWARGENPEAVSAERVGAVGERMAAAVLDAAEPYGTGDVVVAVAHGAAIRAAITTLLGQDADTWSAIFGLENCHWSVLVHAPERTPGWRLLAHNVGALPST